MSNLCPDLTWTLRRPVLSVFRNFFVRLSLMISKMRSSSEIKNKFISLYSGLHTESVMIIIFTHTLENFLLPEKLDQIRGGSQCKRREI